MILISYEEYDEHLGDIWKCVWLFIFRFETKFDSFDKQSFSDLMSNIIHLKWNYNLINSTRIFVTKFDSSICSIEN